MNKELYIEKREKESKNGNGEKYQYYVYYYVAQGQKVYLTPLNKQLANLVNELEQNQTK